MSALAGRTIVDTRPREQAAPFAELLVRRGARIVMFPTIATRAADPAEADRTIARFETYAWVIIPSANAVRFFLDRASHGGEWNLY